MPKVCSRSIVDAGVVQRRQDARQRRHRAGRIQAHRGGAGVVGFNAHRHVARLAVAQQRAEVAEGDGRRGGGDVVHRQRCAQLAQVAAERGVVQVIGQRGKGVVPAIEHGQQRTLDVGFEVERIARGVGDQVDAGQRAVGNQGLRAHVAGARAFFQRGCQRGGDSGAVTLARHVDQHVQVARVDVAAGEHTGARLLVQRHDRAAYLCQPFRIGFERFGARQRLEDLEEFLGAEAFLAYAGQAQYLGNAAACERQARQRGRGGGAGEQADKAVLAEDVPLCVGVAHADEVERLVAVQRAFDVGLDDRQRLGAAGQGDEVARDVGQAGAVDRMRGVLQHADAARDVAFKFAHARLDDVVCVAERLEAFVFGPLEERGHFLAGAAVRGGLRGDGGQAVGHRDRIAAHHGGVARHHLQLGDQRRQFLGAEVFRQQAQDVRFERGAGFADRHGHAGGVAPHRQDRVHHAADGDALLAHRHHDRVDQVRHVVVQDQQRGGHAAAAIGVAQLGDFAARRFAPGGLGETFPQDGREAVGRSTCEVFFVQ